MKASNHASTGEKINTSYHLHLQYTAKAMILISNLQLLNYCNAAMLQDHVIFREMFVTICLVRQTLGFALFTLCNEASFDPIYPLKYVVLWDPTIQ